MNWINFFFYVIVLNSLTGTVAYLLCKLLALVAKRYNAIRIAGIVVLYCAVGISVYEVQELFLVWCKYNWRWIFGKSGNL